jgi:Mg2+-importing ATPase
MTFGAVDVLCTDKTGTLTEDRVVLVQHIETRENQVLFIARREND